MSIASEIRPPVFSGKAEEDCLGWIMRFDTVAQALDWDSARKMTQMPLYFGGFASIWWNQYTENGKKPATSYETAIQELKKRFLPADYKRQLRAKIRQRRLKRDEEVTEYFNEVLTLCYQYDARMKEEEIIEKLREGLYSEMYNKVLMSKAITTVDFFADMTMAAGAMRREAAT